MLTGSVVYPPGIALAILVLVLGRDWPRTILTLVAVAHLTILASVALFPVPIESQLIAAGRVGPTAAFAEGNLNLVPFATIGSVLAGGGGPGAAGLLILNLFVLLPAGVYLPVLVPALRRWVALIPFAIVGGASIELLQLAISTVLGYRYRSIDVDDAILNAAGLVLGWLVVALGLAVRSRLRQRPR